MATKEVVPVLDKILRLNCRAIIKTGDFNSNMLGIFNTFNVGVKCAEIKGITAGENVKLLHIDSEVLKCGDQIGFVTLVVHTRTYGN